MAQVCGTDLFALQMVHEFPCITRVSEQCPSHHKKPKFNRPLATFVVQDFREWLTWFLSLADIKEAIDSWASKCCSSNSECVSDYNQSLAWKTLYASIHTPSSSWKNPLHLAFSLFVDWFNPLGNKLSGRQVSISVLALHCVNLPPSKRHLIKNTYLAGIVPAPNQPDMVTISNLLQPIVDELIELNQGIQIPTY
ncbi:hypothetical protein CROQUDRAFT_90560 [Cronartium quercuum f. sp. fusiforme G11]|uniref:Uncharacterized protein n=1 Tax=Cronartium quercuum f. sp. fusiforme G11 TaxID=708437 RepID=A0A9P6NLM2_9BASI|nr:hypothetical protein CROQUDRAFT_90560 [Cronartium quercuum f. sp. fusiforme G11]